MDVDFTNFQARQHMLVNPVQSTEHQNIIERFSLTPFGTSYDKGYWRVVSCNLCYLLILRLHFGNSFDKG